MTGGYEVSAQDRFYEWLLSDHPDARAERDARREAAYRDLTENAAAVLAWAAKISATPGAPGNCGSWPRRWGRSRPNQRHALKLTMPNRMTCTSLASANSTKPTCGSPGPSAHTTTATPST